VAALVQRIATLFVSRFFE